MNLLCIGDLWGWSPASITPWYNVRVRVRARVCVWEQTWLVCCVWENVHALKVHFLLWKTMFQEKCQWHYGCNCITPMNENGRMRSHYGRRKYGLFSFLQPNIILLTELYRKWYRLLALCLYLQCLVDKAQIIPPVLLRFKVKTQITFTWLHYRLWIDSMTHWWTTEITLTFSSSSSLALHLSCIIYRDYLKPHPVQLKISNLI